MEKQINDSPKMKILVVDDDSGLLAVLEASLQSVGHDVTAILSAAKAIEAISAEVFDLVVTDYSLNDPQINGITILQHVQQVSPQTQVVIITAYASLEITLKAINYGAYDFLTKPFQMEELLLVTRNVGQMHGLQLQNGKLRSELSEVIESLEGIAEKQVELIERLNQLHTEPGDGADTPVLSGAQGLNSPEANELRRRRMREQLNTYQRMGVQITEWLHDERERLQNLRENG